jgi:Rad52/22 family double-strand break repair protein
MTTSPETTAPTPPLLARRTITEIITDLSKPIPDNMLEERKQGGTALAYIPWHQASRLLDRYAPGWSYEILRETVTDGKDGKGKETRTLALTVRLTIPAADGQFSRDATGIEELIGGGGYGDAWSNASSMAFRRAAAMFGLARYLYRKGD